MCTVVVEMREGLRFFEQPPVAFVWWQWATCCLWRFMYKMMVNKGYFCINKGYFCKLGEVDAHIWRYLGMICTRTCHQGTLSKSFRHDLHTDLSSPRAHCQNKNKSHCQYCLYMEAGMICIRTCHHCSRFPCTHCLNSLYFHLKILPS